MTLDFYKLFFLNLGGTQLNHTSILGLFEILFSIEIRRVCKNAFALLYYTYNKRRKVFILFY